jgi:hypothetical protein
MERIPSHRLVFSFQPPFIDDDDGTERTVGKPIIDFQQWKMANIVEDALNQVKPAGDWEICMVKIDGELFDSAKGAATNTQHFRNVLTRLTIHHGTKGYRHDVTVYVRRVNHDVVGPKELRVSQDGTINVERLVPGVMSIPYDAFLPENIDLYAQTLERVQVWVRFAGDGDIGWKRCETSVVSRNMPRSPIDRGLNIEAKLCFERDGNFHVFMAQFKVTIVQDAQLEYESRWMQVHLAPAAKDVTPKKRPRQSPAGDKKLNRTAAAAGGTGGAAVASQMSDEEYHAMSPSRRAKNSADIPRAALARSVSGGSSSSSSSSSGSSDGTNVRREGLQGLRGNLVGLIDQGIAEERERRDAELQELRRTLEQERAAERHDIVSERSTMMDRISDLESELEECKAALKEKDQELKQAHKKLEKFKLLCDEE